MTRAAILTATIVCVFGVMTAGAQDAKPEKGKVICCHDGKCDTEHTLAECARLKGKVVKDCKECR